MTSKRITACAAMFFAVTLGLSGAALPHAGGAGGGGGSAGGGGGAGGGSSAGGGGAAGGGHSSSAGSSAAAGASSNSNSGSNNGSNTIDHNSAFICPRGFVNKAGNCLHASIGVLPDDELYTQGRALALAGYYSRAVPVLEAVRQPSSMVFTMRGFAARKLGNYSKSMALYAKALAIDPDNVNTHEYMGEAYVSLGKLKLARTELATVQKLCGGTGCEQYADLNEAIETGKTE